MGMSQINSNNINYGINMNNINDSTVSENYFLQYFSPLKDNSHGILMAGTNSNIKITNNVTYNIDGYGLIVTNEGQNFDNPNSDILFSGNKLQDQDNFVKVLNIKNITGLTFENNSYYSNNGVENFMDYENNNYSFEEWENTISDDSSTYEYEAFPAPYRSIYEYQNMIKKEATVSAFIESCGEQNRYNWSSQYMAVEVNRWLKDGFRE